MNHHRMIKMLSLTALLVILLTVLSSGIATASKLTSVPAQQGNPTPQPITINPGELPTKTLLASEPLRLHLSGPLDLAYTVDGPETISVAVHSLPSNATPLDTTIEITDPQGNQVAFNDDLTADSRDAGVTNVDLKAAGTYTIRLNTFDLLQGGGVEVDLTTSNARDSGNPGGGPILDVTDTLDGNSPGSYSFNGSAGQVVTITAQATNPVSPDLDLSMILYGPDGSEVANDDDTGGSNGLGERDPALMHFSLPQTGEYRVEVNSWFNTPGDIAVKVEPG